MDPRRVAVLGIVLSACAIAVCAILGAAPASAHGFSSTVYAKVGAVDAADSVDQADAVDAADSGDQADSGDAADAVRTELDLEYDLLIVSVADLQDDDALYRAGMPAWEDGDLPAQQQALNDNRAAALAYITQRFVVSADGTDCAPAQVGDFVVHMRDVPYAATVLDWACPPQEHDAQHEVRSSLFADDEGYVKGAETIVTYNLDGHSGSAVLDKQNPSFSIQQSLLERFWEFFRLGAEHLYTGADHILFLLALIVGSRRVREVVLAATTFTLAHSVTFVLAALGIVTLPASIIEPLIALSIAVVAAWYLWRLVTRRGHASDIVTRSDSHFALDRAGWMRLGVVFAFGLIHGLGFASALGIDEPFSWSLLSSLLVFNVGIEFVQLAVIALIFPTLMLLRHRSPALGMGAAGVIAGGVAVVGSLWFLERALAF